MSDPPPVWLRLVAIVMPVLASASLVLTMGCEASWGLVLGLAYGCFALAELGYLAWLFASAKETTPSDLTRSGWQSHS